MGKSEIFHISVAIVLKIMYGNEVKSITNECEVKDIY